MKYIKPNNNLNLEFERRYFVDMKKIPFSQAIDSFMIEQNYVYKDKCSVRVRHEWNDVMNKFTHCVKYKLEDSTRLELENPITEAEYNVVNTFIGRKPLKKERVIIPLSNGSKAEIDIFKNIDKPPVVEVEFSTMEEMRAFTPPDWFGEEITFKGSYSERMYSLLNGESSAMEELDFV